LIHRSSVNEIDLIYVQATSADTVTQATDEVTQVLRQRHHTPIGIDDFTIFSQKDILSIATTITGVFTIFIGGIAGISLLVGGIGIMNIMLVSVTERTREIGIRMAIGARSFDVLFQFLTEAVMVCFIGGLLGIFVGIGGGLATSAIAGWRVIFTVAPIIIAFACASLTGIIFGYLPARKAAQLDPIEALARE
jgi:ABC-type antimicrobial peptide transport system permease subunit